jgi:hypothetical protein
MKRPSSSSCSRLVLALWVIFLCKGTFYCLLFPVWEGYDEYAHHGFVEFFGATSRVAGPGIGCFAGGRAFTRIVASPLAATAASAATRNSRQVLAVI